MRSPSPAWPHGFHRGHALPQREQGSICSSRTIHKMPSLMPNCQPRVLVWQPLLSSHIGQGTTHFSPFCSSLLHSPRGKKEWEISRGENCCWDYLQNYCITCIFKRRCLWVNFIAAVCEISYIMVTQTEAKAQSINKAPWSSLELRW